MSFSSPEVIFSSLAAIIAFLTLWFTNLKGPDIELLSRPDVSYGAVSDPLWRVPNTIRLQPLQLVFANHGSRGGLITEIRVELEPEPWFVPYYRSVECTTQPRGTPEMDLRTGDLIQQPIPIAPGESIAVQLSCDIVMTTRKDYPEELDVSMKLGEALRSSLDHNQAAFTAFVNTLANDQPIGNMNLIITVTARKWSYRTILQKRSIARFPVPALSANWVIGFQKAVALWGDLYPSVQQVVKDALSEVRRLREAIEGRLPHLITPIPEKHLSPLPMDIVTSWYLPDRSYPQWAALRRALLGWDASLASALSQYKDATNRFNLEVERFNLRKAMGDADSTSVQKCADDIRSIVEKTVDSLRQLEANLTREI